MSRQRHELRIYHNQELMNDLNMMFIRIKKYMIANENLLSLFSEVAIKYNTIKPPSHHELDNLMDKLMVELRKDSEPMIKY